MSATYELFERWKAAKAHASTNAAALALGERRQTVQHWKDGKNGGAEVIERMCADLGEDPVPVILKAFAEAARDTEDRKALQRLARRFKAALAGLMLASVAAHYPAPSKAADGHENSQGVFIMRTLGEWLKRLQQQVQVAFGIPFRPTDGVQHHGESNLTALLSSWTRHESLQPRAV